MSTFCNIPLGSVIPVFFDSYAGATGASVTISGLAITDIEIFKGTSMTQRSSDAGYVLLDTDGIDLDGITGIQGFSIDTGDNTDAGFFAAGSFYNVVVSAITVDTQTVNFVAMRFRLVAAEGTAGTPVADATRWNNLATVALPLIPTTAGRTLDVSAGGEAGVDWANVGSPTTTVGLSGTTVKTATDVETDTADIQARLPAALTANGNIKADTLRVGGTVQTAGDLAALITTVAGYLDTEIADIITELAKVPKSDSNVTLNATVLAAIADAFLNRNMATGTDSGSTTVRTPRQALRALRNKWAVSAGTMTVYKEDDSAASWTSALTGDATADPIVESDPAGP